MKAIKKIMNQQKETSFFFILVILWPQVMWSQNMETTHSRKSPIQYTKGRDVLYSRRGAVNSHINVYKLIGDKDVDQESMHLGLAGPSFFLSDWYVL
jgi:hypothetical protein